MIIWLFYAFLIVFYCQESAFCANLSHLSSIDCTHKSTHSIPYNDIDKNPYIPHEEKKKILPFLLPLNHAIKPLLDSIFIASRASLNENTFAAAGFLTKCRQPRSFLTVASHPRIPGYLFKVYLDSENRIKKDTPGWQWMLNRIKLANKIQKYIKKRKFRFFCVPQKWIYPLPLNPSPPNDSNYVRKNEILVVEDMELTSKQDNFQAWKTIITKEYLDEFYAIIKHAGGSSYRAENVAYTIHGKFAFIDTEYANQAGRFDHIDLCLSPEMLKYWKELTKNDRGIITENL